MLEDQDTIANASAIIEKFGGIRPMATKLNIPVTTVQGWKQRNVIPANRRDEIIAAASAHRLNLGDLLIQITNSGTSESPAEVFESVPMDPPVRRERFDKVAPRSDATKPLIYGGIVMLAGAIIGGVFAIAPHVKSMGQEDQRVAELQAEIERMKQEQAAAVAAQQTPTSFLPDSMKQSLTDLEGKVQNLSAQAQNYSAIVEDLKTGNVEQRIAKLEGHLNEMIPQTRALGLSGMLQKVQGMQQTPQGSDSLGGILNLVLAQMETATVAGPAGTDKPGTDKPGTDKKADASKTDTMLADLMASNPDVAQTFEGVAPEDMKAAAMLLAMAQMRQSLARDNDSFETDLKILKMTAAKDDPALQEAIDRLAPKARDGVLTPDGLSKEFRGLAGEIVAASLSGEDVSVQDKLKARLNDVIVVEKACEQISGTQTQKTITEAQKKLDQGDVPAAVALLKTLDGPAAEKSQPFIANAEATIASHELQQALGQNVMVKLQTALHDPKSINAATLKGLMGQVQSMVPGQGIVSDPASGFSMLPPSPFKVPTSMPQRK